MRRRNFERKWWLYFCHWGNCAFLVVKGDTNPIILGNRVKYIRTEIGDSLCVGFTFVRAMEISMTMPQGIDVFVVENTYISSLLNFTFKTLSRLQFYSTAIIIVDLLWVPNFWKKSTLNFLIWSCKSHNVLMYYNSYNEILTVTLKFSYTLLLHVAFSQTSFLLISLIKSSVKLSDTQRNKCRVSIITWSSEMKLNKGVSLQLIFFDLANLEVSSNDLAPWALLESDHTLLICLWL